MKFRIIKKGEERYEVFYLDEFNNGGPKWQQVIWDTEGYCNFLDCNYIGSVEEAHKKAKEFAEQYKQKKGEIIKEFEIPT